MRDVSLFIALGGGGPEAITQATSWAQKGLDVVNTTRESHKGKPECDTAFILLLYHLGWMQTVSEIFILLFFAFHLLKFFFPQISGEYDKGRESFKTVLKESKAMKMKSYARYAQEQLDKLDAEKR